MKIFSIAALVGLVLMLATEVVFAGSCTGPSGVLQRLEAETILDDVATTGGSSLQAAMAVEAFGCKVGVVIVVLDRLEGAAAAFAARGFPFHPLLTIRDLGVEPLPVNI